MLCNRTSGRLTAIIAVLVCLTAAGCSSSKGSTATNTTTSSSSLSSPTSSSSASSVVSAAQANLAGLLTAPTGLPVTTPLSTKPPAGKTVYFLEGNDPSIQVLAPAFQAATAVLGWHLKVITFSLADNPPAADSACLQALSEHADYIFDTGDDASTLPRCLPQAKAAKVPLFLFSSAAPVGGASTGVYTVTGGVSWNITAALALVDWAIVDSGGSPHILWVTIPGQILKDIQAGLQANVAKICPTCSFSILPLSINDLTTGGAPGAIVSALRKDPSIKYVQLAYGGIFPGLPAALTAAGLHVKVTEVEPDKAGYQGFAAGQLSAIAPINELANPWLVVDAMARYSVGDDVEATAHSGPIWQVWTKANAPNPVPTNYPNAFNIPSNYQSQFEQLWHV